MRKTISRIRKNGWKIFGISRTFKIKEEDGGKKGAKHRLGTAILLSYFRFLCNNNDNDLLENDGSKFMSTTRWQA